MTGSKATNHANFFLFLLVKIAQSLMCINDFLLIELSGYKYI